MFSLIVLGWAMFPRRERAIRDHSGTRSSDLSIERRRRNQCITLLTDRDGTGLFRESFVHEVLDSLNKSVSYLKACLRVNERSDENYIVRDVFFPRNSMTKF